MEVQKLISKGMRLSKPRTRNLKLRPQVSDWFDELALSARCNVTVLLVGILEDFYDRHKNEVVTQSQDPGSGYAG